MSRLKMRPTSELEKKLNNQLAFDPDMKLHNQTVDYDVEGSTEELKGVILNQQSQSLFDQDPLSNVTGSVQTLAKSNSQNSKRGFQQTPKSGNSLRQSKTSQEYKRKQKKDVQGFMASKMAIINPQPSLQTIQNDKTNHFNINLSKQPGGQRQIPTGASRGPIKVKHKPYNFHNLPALGNTSSNATSYRQNMRGIVKNYFKNTPNKKQQNDPSQPEVGDLNKWYNKRQSNSRIRKSDISEMVAHYNQHLSDGQVKNAQSIDDVSLKTERMNQDGLPVIGSSSQQASGKPQINYYKHVHQHFNQPNITNYNQNQYYMDTEKDNLMSLEHRQASQMNMTDRVSIYNDLKRNNSQIHASKGHASTLKNMKGRTLQNQTGQQAWVNKSNRINKNSEEKNNSLTDIKETAVNEDLSQSAISETQKVRVMEVEGSADVEFLGRDESLDHAINQNAQQLDRDMRKNIVPPIYGMQKAVVGPNLKNLNRAYKKTMKYYGGGNPYGNLRKFNLENSARRMIKMYQPTLENFQKEDMYDQLLLQKSQINQLMEDIKNVKTRNLILLEQLKQKDKFITELFRSMNVNQSSQRNLEELTGSSLEDSGRKASKGELKHVGQRHVGVLKLKKQIGDLKEIIQMKQIENDDMARALKKSRLVQLQTELQIYQRENKKLKVFNNQIMEVATRNGFEHQIDQQSREYFTSGPSSHQQSPTRLAKKNPKENLVLQQLVYQNASMSDKLSHDQQKLYYQKHHLQRLQEDRSALIEIDQEKNKTIVNLQSQIKTLKSINSQSRSLSRSPERSGSHKNLSKSYSSRTRLQSHKRDVSMADDNFTTVEHTYDLKQAGPPSDLRKQIKRLNLEKERVQKQLIQERNLKNEIEEKYVELEKRLEEPSKKPLRDSPRRKDLAAEKLKKEKFELKNKYELQSAQVIQLQKKVQQMEHLQNNQTRSRSNLRSTSNGTSESAKKSGKVANFEDKKKVLELTKTMEILLHKEEKSAKQAEDYKKSLNLNNKKIKTLEEKIRELELRVNDKVSRSGANQISREAFPEAPSFGEPISAERNQKTLTNSTSNKSKQISIKQSNNSMQLKRKTTDKSSKTSKSNAVPNPNLNNSQLTTEELRDERDHIEQHVQNATVSELDQRSDVEFSQMKSQFQSVGSDKSTPIQKGKPKLTKGQNNTIKEDIINEDYDQSHQNMFDSKFEQSVRVDRSSSELIKKSLNQLEGKFIGMEQDGTNLLQQIDQIPTESRKSCQESSDDVRLSTQLAQKNGMMVPFVELNDYSVQKGFERLGRLLQIKRIPLDQIEIEIIQGNYRANQSIQIIELVDIFQKKLGLIRDEAICFARFIVEEKDEEGPVDAKVQLNLNRKVNSLYVPIRLMTNFEANPTLYTDAQEKDALAKFSKVFGLKHQKFVEQIKNQAEAIVSKDQFSKAVKTFVQDGLTEQDIDCAYIWLSRGIEAPPNWDQSRIDKMSEAELAEKTKGFDRESVGQLFQIGKESQDNNSDDENYSEENYSQDQEIVESVPMTGKNTNSVTENFEEEIIEESPRKISRQDSLQGQNVPGTNRSKDDDDFVEEELEEENQVELPPPDSKVSPPEVLVGQTQQVNQDLLENSKNLKPFSEDRSEHDFDDEISVSLKKSDTQGQLRYAKENTPKQEVKKENAIQNEREEQKSESLIQRVPTPQTVEEKAEKDMQKQKSRNFTQSSQRTKSDVGKSKKSKSSKQSLKQQSKQSVRNLDLEKTEETQKSQKVHQNLSQQQNIIVEESPYTQIVPEEEEKNSKSQILVAGTQVSAPASDQVFPVPSSALEDDRTAENLMSEFPRDQSIEGQVISEEDSKNIKSSGKSSAVVAAALENSLNQSLQRSDESKRSVPQIRINMDKVGGALKQELQQKMGSESLAFIKVEAKPVDDYEYYDEEDPEESKENQQDQQDKLDSQPPSDVPPKIGPTMLEQLQQEEMKIEEQYQQQIPTPKSAKEQQKVEKEQVQEQNLDNHIQELKNEEIKIQQKLEETKMEMKEEQQQQNLEEESKSESREQEDPPKPYYQPLNRQNGTDETFEEVQIEGGKAKVLSIAQKNDCEKVELLTHIAMEAIQLVAKSIYKYYPHLIDNCRDIFRDIIFNHRYPEITPKDQFYSNGKAPEIEIIKFEDLMHKFDELILPETLTYDKTYAIKSAFETQALSVGGFSFVQYKDIHNVLKSFGIQDHKVPKGQQNQAHLDYNSLDFKSIRLINRMIHYLGSQQISFSDFMKGLLQKQVVKTKTSDSEVEIFIAKKFFKLLHKSKIIKQPDIHTNLCLFLCIDKKYKSYLMLKKLKRCIIDFNSSDYFQSIGLKKQKLQIPGQIGQKEDDDFDYYDEEDDLEQQDTTQPQITNQIPMQQTNTLQQVEPSNTVQVKAQPVTNASLTPLAAYQQQQITQQQNNPNNPNDQLYGDEYYDEEDDSHAQETPNTYTPGFPETSKSTSPKKPQIVPNSQMFDHQKVQESFATGNSSIPLTSHQQSPQMKDPGKKNVQALQQQQQAPQTGPEYEYYDEEDD